MQACRSGFSLAEALENERKKVRFDASAIVGNTYLDMRVHSFQHHLHAAALGREFDRIRQEVPHHLLQPLEIARHRTGMRVEYGLNPDVSGFGRKAQCVDGRIDDRCRLHGPHIQPKLSHCYSGNIEQVLDQLRLRTDIAIDHFECLFNTIL